ncbi:hypothetical protein, partial [Serratia ficaria]|uniref:hypothetical protein n=2 Tax=Serratia TaxID=613 RepID=UPI0021B72E48
GSSHKIENKSFNLLKILFFTISINKTVKLRQILSTFWAGTVGILVAKRKDKILTLLATAPDQLRRLPTPKIKKEGIGRQVVSTKHWTTFSKI